MKADDHGKRKDKEHNITDDIRDSNHHIHGWSIDTVAPRNFWIPAHFDRGACEYQS
jgi:hypothetical protein